MKIKKFCVKRGIWNKEGAFTETGPVYTVEAYGYYSAQLKLEGIINHSLKPLHPTWITYTRGFHLCYTTIGQVYKIEVCRE